MKIEPLDSLQASYRSVEKFNENFDKIQDAFDNTLSRDGSGPNNMQAPLDLDGHRLINLGAPVDPNDAARLQDLFVREAEGRPVSVKDFGANGTGDVSDSEPIQKAIDAVGAAGGGFVFFPTGTYLIDSTVRLRANVALYGAPGTVTLVQKAGANLTTLIDFETFTANGASITGLRIDGNRENNPGNIDVERFAVFIWDADNVTVRDCIIQDFTGFGVYVRDGLRPIVKDNRFESLNLYGIAVLRTTPVGLNAPVVSGNFMANVAWHAIILGNCQDGRIEDNEIYAAERILGTVVSITGTTVTWVSGPNFATIQPGNFLIFNGGTESLISVKNSDTILTLAAAPGNVTNVPAAAGAADIITAWGCQNTTIQGNKLQGGASLGISLFSTDAGAPSVRDRVLNNQIDSVGSAGLSIQTAGSGVVRDSQVHGNAVTEAGLNTTASAASFNSGFTVSGTAINIDVTNNTFLSYGSAMLGLNVLTPGAVVSVSSNVYKLLGSQPITNGATVALSAGWGTGAAVSELIVQDEVVSFLVTSGSASITASPNFTVTHRTVPSQGKRAVATNTNTNANLLPIVMFYPEPLDVTIGVMVGTPAVSSTYRIVVRL